MSHWVPELLAPAGSLEKLKVAVLYGADAVYLGGQKFGLRSAADNLTYQELEEANAKVRRAKLTSAQLPSYYVGWRGWTKVRDNYQTEPQDFSLSSFHNKALRAGPLPVKELGYIVSEKPMED